MSRILWWLGWAWCFPLTIAGYVLGVWLSEYDYPLKNDGVRVFEAGPWFRRVFFERFHVGGFCWGATIFIPGQVAGQVSKPLRPGLIEHELVHFKQARIFGIFLPLAYGLCSLTAWAQGGHWYRDNALEKWARRESGQ
jgi:hypothetical protein